MEYEERKLDCINRFLDLVRLRVVNNGNDFMTLMIQGLQVLEMSDMEFAQILQIPCSIVTDWKKNNRVPSKMRPIILKNLKNKAKVERQRLLYQTERESSNDRNENVGCIDAS
jgi:hypothetical protein